MEIKEARAEGALVLAPVGRIDSNTSGELEQRLLQHLAKNEKRLVVDLAEVEYISSAGLRVLLVAAKKAPAIGGRLVLCAMGRSVREVFELAGFTAIFTIEASRDLALARVAADG